MAEYIERGVVLKRLRKEACDCEFVRSILEAPAADVAPVVHSFWKVGFTDKENKTTGVECSECNAYFELELFDFGLCYNYCPNCGARMDGA